MTAIGLSLQPGAPRGAPAVAVPTLDLNFLAGTLPSQVTFTRASTAWYFNSAGTLVSAATDAPRFDYNPATLALRGMLIEPAATNSIRNSSATGAVAGTPGTMPTNWTFPVLSGLALEVIGTGTETGLPYVDLKVSGTTNSATQITINLEGTAQVVGASAQVWTLSTYIKAVSGTVPTGILQIVERNSGGTFLVSGTTAIAPTTAALNTQRPIHTRTLNQATTAFISPHIRFNVTDATAYNFTLRVGAPQFELGSAATSPILTTGSATVTRAQETPTVSTLTPWFSATGGAMVAEAMLSSTGLATRTVAQLDDGGTTTNRVFLHADGAGVYRAIISSGGVSSVNTALGSTAAETVFKLGASWAANNFAVAKGATTGTAVSGSVPASISQLRIGHRAGTQLQGWVQRIRVWPAPITLAELQALTT